MHRVDVREPANHQPAGHLVGLLLRERGEVDLGDLGARQPTLDLLVEDRVLGGVTHVIVLAAERSPLLAACAWGRGGGGWGPFTSNVRLRR
jgi:hypothetical protein